MAAGRIKTAGTLVSEALQLTVECGICTEVKELRMLPCQHMMCKECLDRIIAGPGCCSYCNSSLTERAAMSYPVCRLAANLQQEVEQLTKALENYHFAEQRDICQSGGCPRPIDMYCELCCLFLCFKCTTGSKCVEGDSHKTEVYDEHLQISKAKFESWKVYKQGEIDSIAKERSELTSETLKLMGGASAENLLESLDKAQKKKSVLQTVTKRLAEQEAVLSKYQREITGVCDTEFIKLVDQLSIGGAPGKTARSSAISLGTCSVKMTQDCYDVSDAAAGGQLLVGRSDRYDVLNSRGEVQKSVDTGDSLSHAVWSLLTTLNTVKGDITSIQQYNNCIYTLCAAPPPVAKRQVVVYDTQYNEVRRWSVPDFGYISSLVVCNDKVYVLDSDNKQLCVYSTRHTSGTPLAAIKHPTFNAPVYLSISPPHSIIISDWAANKVHKLDCRDDTVTWSSAVVEDPRGVSCDVNGDVWVWSRKSTSLFILHSNTGELKQEIQHAKFADITAGNDITGMCIMGGVLWAAARRQGLLRFDINQ